LSAFDLDEDFIQMPRISRPPFSVSDPLRELPAKPQTPLSNRLVGDIDPAAHQDLFHVPEAEIESMVQPYPVADDFAWMPVAAIE